LLSRHIEEDNGNIMTSRTFGRVAVLVAAVLLLLSACSSSPPPALTRREIPPNAVSDPANPCVHKTDAAAPGDAPAATGVKAAFDRAANKITLTDGQNVTIPALSKAVNNPGALKETAPGEWLLGAHLEVVGAASLEIAAPSVNWLKMSSVGQGWVTLKALDGGGIDVKGSCITSWVPDQNRVDTDTGDGRSFILARDQAKLTIDKAQISYLGFPAIESYGLSWRSAANGGKITNSDVSYNHYGLYTFQTSEITIADNNFHDNIIYGVDPHTGSTKMTIERNISHDNGKHGIVLAEDCSDNVIRDNIVYNNKHHGIVLYLHSNNNTVENNETFRNVGQGVNINESDHNNIRNNKVYDNGESGIGVVQLASENVLEQNQVRGNQQDGVRLVSEAEKTDVRDNVIGENARYGVYVDSDGAFTLTGNSIFNSQVGVLLKGKISIPSGSNNMFGNKVEDVKNA
jgi:parallel beta-helix repeat protein